MNYKDILDIKENNLFLNEDEIINLFKEKSNDFLKDFGIDIKTHLDN